MPSAIYPDSGRQLIDRATLSAVSSYVSPSWAAGQFGRIEINLILTTTDGTTQPNIVLTGINGAAYRNQIIFGSSASAGAFKDASAAHWNTGILTNGGLKGDILIVTNLPKYLIAQAYSAGTTAFTISCDNTDAVNGVTGMAINFASASTGRVELWGWP